MNKRILLITDNGVLYKQIMEILTNEFPHLKHLFTCKRSKMSQKTHLYTDGIEALEEVNVKTEYEEIIKNYDLVISLHCKQIFPKELVNRITCINIHPGYNPYNRGWYPQVFAIINQERLGATIHLMDEEVDNGAIIDRQVVKIKSYYTSKEAYEKVLEAELELFRRNIQSIIDNTYQTIEPEFKGEYHSIADYNNLCKINLEEQITMGTAINKLRALSHGNYNNAYFIDQEGNKVYIKIELFKE